MRKSYLLKAAVLASAVAVSGGCVSAKMNPDDMAAAPAPAMEKDMGITSYAVAKGDNLWSISEQEVVYGTPFNWPLIYKANLNQIKDADLIYPGQELAIPRGMGQAEIDAAVQHAKMRGAWSVGPTESVDTAYIGG